MSGSRDEATPSTTPPSTKSVDDLADIFSGIQITPKSLYDLVVAAEDPSDILLVGESSTRALSIALALMRGSLKGIWSTSYDNPPLWQYEDFGTTEMEAARSRAERNAGGEVPIEVENNFNRFRRYILQDFQSEKDLLKRLCLVADATKLEDFNKGIDGWKNPPIIWFQCPWTYRIKMGYNTATVIQRFVESAAKFQSIGDVLVIGLVTLVDAEYETSTLFSLAESYGYDRREDTNLIQKCIQHGYRHARTGDESDCDHKKYVAHHITHVFERRSITELRKCKGHRTLPRNACIDGDVEKGPSN